MDQEEWRLVGDRVGDRYFAVTGRDNHFLRARHRLTPPPAKVASRHRRRLRANRVDRLARGLEKRQSPPG